MTCCESEMMQLPFLSNANNYIALFVLFGVLGWGIDTGYRSLEARRYTRGTYFPFFAPSYGMGGLIMVLSFQYLPGLWWMHVLMTWPMILLFEFLSGLFCVHILGRRYWDYSKNTGNVMGHICLLHATYWLLLTITMRALFGVFG